MSYVDPDEEVFRKLDEMRESGELSKRVTTSRFVYQVSTSMDLIERSDRKTGEKLVDVFKNWKFIEDTLDD